MLCRDVVPPQSRYLTKQTEVNSDHYTPNRMFTYIFTSNRYLRSVIYVLQQIF